MKLSTDGDPPLARRIRVKICGITNPADAEVAIALGADALGFNFYRGSPRFLGEAEIERAWLRTLGPLVSRVAVGVNPATPEAVWRWRQEGFVDAVQLHGDEDEVFCRAVIQRGVPLIRALRARDASALCNPEHYGTPDVLLDAFRPGAYGGTGETCDWDLARKFVADHPKLRVVLSGGLTPENVGEAVRLVRPYAVDVASGVEFKQDPRRKDPVRLRDFLQAVSAVQ